MVKASQKKTSKAKVAKSRQPSRRGGRAKGTPNKRTAILNDLQTSLGHDVPQRLMELMPDLF